VAAGLVAVAALTLLASCLLTFITWQEYREMKLKSVRLRFGNDVSADAVGAVLGGLSGLPRRAVVVFEVVADEKGIAHHLHASASTLELVRSQLRGVLPGVRFDPLPEEENGGWTDGARLRWSGFHPVLQTDQAAETAAALLGAFSSLHQGEGLRLMWLLSPTRRPGLPRRDTATERQRPTGLDWLVDPQPSPEQLRALRQKYAGPILHGRAVLMARSQSRRSSAHLLGRVVAVLRSRHSSWGRLSVRRQRPRPLHQLSTGLHRGSRFSPAELAGLIGWPIDAPRVPGLTLATAPQLMPAARLPRAGRVYARSDWPGMEDRQLAQSVIGGLSHALIVGPTGSGKSHLLASLVTQDMAAGRGCLVLDGKGDLARDVLARVPEHRRDEVIVLDPGADLPPPGLRVFAPGTDPELVADLVLGIFRELFADSWGVRSDKWLRAGLVTLAHDDHATLASLSLLFSDDRYRRELVGKLRDPLLMETWAAFEAMSPQERTHQLGSPLTKVSEVIGRRVVRAVLAQPEPQLDMRDVLATGKVVIVSLSAGRIGVPASRLLGALVIHELFQAVQARTALAPARRRPFFAYVDEPKVLGDMPVPLDSLFELARGLGVGLTLGAQSLTQLPQAVQRAALTNAATIIAFKQSADDAALLARELRELNAEELQGFGRFEVAARLGLGPGDTAPVATGVTLPLSKPVGDPRVIRRASAKRYGAPLAAIDEALRRRHGLGGVASAKVKPDAPVGRVRRSS
jgi:Type IV secretion-system coupling protein DNA-binding domain